MSQYKTFKTMAEDKDKVINKDISPDVSNISSIHHRADVIKNNRVVVIYYHADWCGPCKDFSPKFNVLAQKYSRHGISFVKEDVDLDLDKPVNVTAVPCFHFYHAGQFQEKMSLTGVDLFSIETNLNSLREHV
jgi:thioredoxin 1